MTEDKDKAGPAKVNESGYVKKVAITTNNRIPAGFNSERRSNGHKMDTKCSKRFIPPQTDGMICFYSNISVSESKVIFK